MRGVCCFSVPCVLSAGSWSMGPRHDILAYFSFMDPESDFHGYIAVTRLAYGFNTHIVVVNFIRYRYN